jgi:hypothetical protein
LRRHAKASSAGSLEGSGNSRSLLGRTFAIRGASGNVSGSGASAHRRAGFRLLTVFCLAVVGTMALAASSALAAKTHPYTGTSFGPDGTAATSFGNLQGVAVDQVSGDVFAYDAGAGKVYKFDAGGTPVDFSALTGNAIEGVGGAGGGEEELAVAPAGAPGGTAGDIYVANNQVVKIYAPSGTQLGQLTGGETCGVAVNPAGHVFVGLYSTEVREYTPTANPVSNGDETGSSSGVLSGVCNVAADGLGDIYGANYSGSVIVKLAGTGDPTGTRIEPGASTMAVDPSNNDLYADRGSEVVQYDSSGNLIGTSGSAQLSSSHGIAVNAGSDEIYVSAGESGKLDIFGPAIVVPGLTVEPTTGLTGTKATLNATVNPAGVAISECKFEYGTTSAYGSSKPCEGAIPTDSSDHPVAAALTGLTPNTTYHFRILAANANGISHSADQTFTTNLPAATKPATSVTATKATLNGGVFPEGEAVTECNFEYGTSESYGSSLPCEGAIPTDEGEHPVTGVVAGLSPNTTYYFRIVAANANGTNHGVGLSFTTNQPAVTQEATGVAGSEATLNGAVFPEGEAVTECNFEYGTSESYGSSLPCEGAIPTDNGEHAVTAQLSHLAPNGTVYHFRLVIDGADGPAHGGDRRFTTMETVTTGNSTAVGATTATLEGSLNPEGMPYTECSFEYGPSKALGRTAPCAESPAEIGEGTSSVPIHADLNGLGTGITYHYRLVGTNADGMARGIDATFTTIGARIEAEWASSVGLSEATLKARVNPRGQATTYHLEYGIDTTYGQSTSETGAGAGEVGHTVIDSLEGLTAGTTYHYRYVASNSSGVSEGEDHTFITYSAFNPAVGCPNQNFRGGFSAPLPDCRAFEMVSPVDKRGGDVKALYDIYSFSDALDQSSAEGGRFTFSSYRAFADSKAGIMTDQYMASREEGTGWTSQALIPSQGFGGSGAYGLNANFENEYKGFSSDLCSGWISVVAEPVLAPGAAENYLNLYRRDGCGSASYEALVTAERLNRLPGAEPELQGMSTDGSVAVIRDNEKLTPDAQGGEVSETYLASDGELHFICILPSGVPDPGDCSAGTDPELVGPGAGGAAFGDSALNHSASVSHAISADGSSVYWTSADVEYQGTGRVYLRKNPGQQQSAMVAGRCTEPGKACTLKVSETISSQPARFLDASSDGSKALFEFTQGSLSGNLYEYNAETETSHLIAQRGLGIAGAGDDLADIYFVSEEDLAGTVGATAGRPNLYLEEEGTRTFIATLSRGDVARGGEGASVSIPSDIDPLPRFHTARTSLDGQRLAFISTEPVTGYDNTDASSSLPCGVTEGSEEGICDSEVYLYEAGAAGPRCVSCNPSGARPQGRSAQVSPGSPSLATAGSMTLATNQLYLPHVLSGDGRRLFFNSYDALLPRDTNGKEDVYEWEAASGQGACEEKGAGTYVASSEGCLSLISSGESPSDSELLDASSNGNDVFFTTNASLLPQDPGLIDVYDARVGGGFPRPATAVACEGEACQGPLSPPNDPTPGSATFNGPGNVKEGPAAKKAHKKKHGKKQSQGHKKKHAKKSHKNRRTGR